MLTIGKLAAQTDLSTNALRFYEREGLIQPSSKSPSGYRLYDEPAVARVRFIKHAQQCGFTLTEIQELLTLRSRDSACCDDVRRLAVERKLQLEAKIRSMKVMSKALDLLISDCPEPNRPVEDCPILGAMEQVSTRVRR
jgi:MerR family Zn(II)-responsive transcriptional regulator of zntA